MARSLSISTPSGKPDQPARPKTGSEEPRRDPQAQAWIDGNRKPAIDRSPQARTATNRQALSDNDRSATARAYASEPEPAPALVLPGCAKNGSCYGDISANTGRPKTTHVDGYYRNGTYVRGHYRSK